MKFQLLVVLAGLCLPFFLARAQTGVPTIASLSPSQTLTEGRDVTLTVSVNGASPFSYQWRKGGSAISGATGSSLTFTPIRTADAGTYTVVVTNAIGSVTSGPVVMAVNPAVAPTFYYQPGAASFVVGNTLSLSASVSGTEPMTFVWKKGAAVVATTTSSYYSKADVQLSDAGSYTITATNIAGSVTSNAFTVTVNPITAPTISTLYDVTVDHGDSIWLYPSISGSGTITYQWKKDGVAITGATGYSYSKYNMQAADAGNYTVTATNSAGSTTSNAAKVTVRPPVAPTISSVSGPVSVVAGESFYVSVYAYGTGPLSYQWRKDGVPITGATSSYYSKSNAQAADAGAYTAVVSNAQGSVTSEVVTVAITNAQPPVITYHPASIAVRQGEYIYSISVGASGTGLSYKWSKDGVAIPGATSYNLYFGHVASAADAGAYTVVVSSAQGSATSEPCYISILPASAPVINYQLASQTLRQGQTLSLSASYYGTPSPTIQWRKDGVAIPGATSSSYYKSNVASSDAGVYSFVVTNSAGSATSENATITVIADRAPQIIGHPASGSLLPGDSFYGIYVEVLSNANYTVQWYRDGTLIPGATSYYYSIYNAQPSIAGTYTAVATNSAGSVTSREGVVTVDANNARPVITYVQGSRSVQGGNNVYLGISTSSSGETVQWFKDGLIIPNATGKEYSFNNFALGSIGSYTAQVTNAGGTFTSRPIVLELMDSGIAPLITRQPVAQSRRAGDSVEFGVTAEGESRLTYQWRRDGVNIAGATSSYYYIYSVSASNAGAYTVVVTNRNGTATSSSAALTITPSTNVAPVITQHPASQTASAGSGYISLSVSLLDSTGASYQWKKNGVAVPNATSSSLYFYSVNASTAGRYSVVVTNAAGSATSYDAVVSVISSPTGPTFTLQPQSKTAYYGTNVSFTATAASSSAVTYQWRKNGTAISGATNSTLTLSNVQNSDAGTYTVMATDLNGSTPSAAATLTIAGGVPPFIITSPSSVTAIAGTTVTLTGSAGGTPLPTYQWQKNGVDLPGATNASYVLSNVQSSDVGNYAMVARNAVGNATSAAATLSVIYPPPTITTQPLPVSVQPGGSATFSVVASNVPPPTFQWRKDGVNLPGATSSTLTLTNVQFANSGRYSVVVRTDFGSVTSVEALLTVGNPITVVPPTNVTVTAGQSASLVATVQSIDPLVFNWAKNGVFIPGATSPTLTFPAAELSHAGTYVLVISRPNGTVIYPLAGSSALAATLTVLPRLAPTFTQHPFATEIAIGAKLTLTAQAQGNGSVSYQWRKDGTPIAGATSNTFVIAAVAASDAGDYTVVATDANGSTQSIAARVTVIGSFFAGTYFGTFPTGETWALQVAPDGAGVFMATIAGRGQAIVARNFFVQPSGAFSFGQTVPTAAAGASAFGARYFDGVVEGHISSGTSVSGQIPGLGLSLAGTRAENSNSAADVGHVQAVPLVSDMGQIDALVAPDGTVFLIAVDANGVRGGRATVTSTGTFTISQPTFVYNGTIAVSQRRLLGTYTPANGAPVPFDTAAAPTGSERLANVATRGLAGSGARTLTAGFVISGSAPKEVLIRAVGPGLTGFGVPGVLPNPRLKIFRDGTAVMENDDWVLGGFSTQLAEAAARVGAFSLTSGSADAAIIARLEPGAYTAQIGSDVDAVGVALVEVYDTSTPTAGAPKLINLSTRGEVGRGGDILIVGVVVSGTAAKRILIRGIGPALSDFGVSGALADPKLQLYQGSALLRENDNWSDSPDSPTIANTATAVGAFTLPSGSKDAALHLYLPPGSYTAQVSGVNSTTGVALVEVYEVP
jgi:hypothetical protein